MSVRRRGNGLTAQSYVLLLDLDPRLSERLLAALAGAGVAAYTTASSGRAGPFLELHLPSRPMEAVHVDATRRPEARRVLEQTMPDVAVGLPSVEEEDEFAALVAAWDEEPATHDWPASEDLDDPSPPRHRPAGRAREISPAPAEDQPASKEPETEAQPEESAPRGEDKPADASATAPVAGAEHSPDADDPEDHFVPPTLAPLPPSHPVTKWGLVALGLGLVLLIFPTLLGLEHTTPVDLVGVVCIVASVGLLVSRLSSRSTDEYEGPDDGAVV